MINREEILCYQANHHETESMFYGTEFADFLRPVPDYYWRQADSSVDEKA